MNYLIIEDEPLAADRLHRMVSGARPESRCLAKIEAADAVVEWLLANPAPDLAFLDIQLADGLSFSIFDQVPWQGPVIFTTAFDHYALRAFKVNSIDYLLKPVREDELAAALRKYDARQSSPMADVLELIRNFHPEKPLYRTRFLVNKGDQLISVPVSEVVLFFAEQKTTFLQTLTGQRYFLAQSLAEIEATLDPLLFFRLNRSCLASHKAVTEVRHSFNRKLVVKLKGASKTETVSRERMAAFRVWLGG